MAPRILSGHRRIPVDQWPSTDRVAWLAALEPCDPLSAAEGGSAAHLAPSTRRNIEDSYGRWLGYLEAKELLQPNCRPGDRASLGVVRAYHDSIKDAGLGDYTLANRLRGLTAALRVVAPKDDWRWIARTVTKIQKRAAPVRDVDARLQPIEDVVALGIYLMAKAEMDEGLTAMERAILYRDGLMVALMTHRPLRLANATAIRIGEHLHRRGPVWWLSFPRDEMKKRRAYECPVPYDLHLHLDRYLDVYRPILLCGNCDVDALWVSSKGNAFADGMVAQRITKRTADRFGTSINPHSFRHLSVTTVSEDAPEHITDAARILGHANLKTTEKYYIRGRMLQAHTRLHETVRDARKRKGRLPNMHGVQGEFEWSDM
jgi:integrase/recombinase XerC